MKKYLRLDFCISLHCGLVALGAACWCRILKKQMYISLDKTCLGYTVQASDEARSSIVPSEC